MSIVPTYEALASDLKSLGVECVFGLMSDDTALFLASIDSVGIRFFGARHENNAVAMAEGYASATGRLGVVILGRGPATTNGLHGIVYAQRSGSPVLVIMGDAVSVPPAANGLGPDTKRLNARGVLQSAGISTLVAESPLTARNTLMQAAANAMRGATALLLPTNVQQALIDSEATRPTPVETKRPQPVAPREAAIEAAATLLQRSNKPLFVVGAGAHKANAKDALIQLAEHVGAVFATSMKAKDLFAGHPYNCGVIGSFSHAAGRRLIEQADCVVVFGAGLNQRTTSLGTSLPKEVPLIQVDTMRDHIGRWYHCDVAVVGDANLVAQQLLQALPARANASKPLHAQAIQEGVGNYDLANDFTPQHTPRTLDPRTVGLELDRLLPADKSVVYDAGNFLSVAPYVSVPNPSHIKQASDFSSIGMGFGTAIGYACANPNKTTALFIGDGSFLMTMGELETVAREGLPLVIVLMNDCAYGAELHYLKLRNMPVSLSQFPDVDYAPIAEAFGFQAATIRTLDELRALRPMLAKPEGPILLDCKINAAVAAPFLFDGIEQDNQTSASK